MEDSGSGRYSIRTVESKTGIPRSTLRYYESEFPHFIKVEKTAGGHRRYTDYNVEQFLYLKSQIQDKGLSLSTVRDSLSAGEDPRKLRQDIDLTLKVTEELVKENKLLKGSLQQLYDRLRHIEEMLMSPDARKALKKKKFKWFD